jgi:serine/threonine protein kinase
LVHADIKPENILLCDQSYQAFTYGRMRPSCSAAKSRESRHVTQRRVLLNTEIRLIDFGLATFQDESQPLYDATPQYCAPETRLGFKASFARDIWSIGCTLVEFFTGNVLFDADELPEYLAMLEAVAGLEIEKEIAQVINEKFEDILSDFIFYAMRESRDKVKKMKMKHLDVSDYCPNLVRLWLICNSKSFLETTLSLRTLRIY